MVRSYITNHLISFLKKHVHNIDEKNLELALLSGTIKLENILLKTESIQPYLRVNVQNVYIKSIIIKLSLLNLLYKPIEISINGLEIVVGKEFEFTEADLLFAKKKFIEEQTEKMGKKKSISNFLMKIFENAIFEACDLSIYYIYKRHKEGKNEAIITRNNKKISTIASDNKITENTFEKSINILDLETQSEKLILEQNQKNVDNQETKNFTHLELKNAKFFYLSIKKIYTKKTEVKDKRMKKRKFIKSFGVDQLKFEYIDNLNNKTILDLYSIELAVILYNNEKEDDNDIYILLEIPSIYFFIDKKIYKRMIKSINFFLGKKDPFMKKIKR